MTKELKKIIDESVRYNGEPLNCFYIVSTNKQYNGVWGKNGYNGMIIIGYSNETDKYYNFGLDYERDVFHCFKQLSFSIDIPQELNCIRLFFNTSIVVEKEQLSAFIVDFGEQDV